MKSELDKFYTKSSVAIRCISTLDLSIYDQVIEPSAGNGSFSHNISHDNLLALDLLPEDDTITQMNWFDYIPNLNYNKVLVIGNPPFGIRNTLSRGFITHSIYMFNVVTIAFILPNVFLKHTNQKIFPSNWRLKSIISIEDNAFLLDNIPYHVPCSFFVWDKSEGEDLRFNPELYTSCDDFEFCDKRSADYYITGAAPHLLKDPNNIIPRGYYIRALDISKEELKHKFESIKWLGHSSVSGGNFWLTKPEIIKTYLGG